MATAPPKPSKPAPSRVLPQARPVAVPRAPVESPPGQRVLIVGPTKSGKTSWLSTLRVAAQRSQRQPPPDRCRIRAANDKMQERWNQVDQKLVALGTLRPGPSQEISLYRFTFEAGVAPPPSGALAADFVFVDGPGGDLIYPAPAGAPGADKRYEADLTKHAAFSQGLVFCVDANDASQTMDYHQSLSRFLARASQPANGTTPARSGDLLPYKRIVILMTKADMIYRKDGRFAEELLLESDPRHDLAELVPDFVDRVRHCARPDAVLACGYVSAYGFIPNEGTANYDKTNDGLLAFDPDVAQLDSGKILALWRPFRVLDPLVFLTTGNLGSLQLVE